MTLASAQIDERLAPVAATLTLAKPPARGWVRAIRDALGMTSYQMASRLRVKQPRIIALEKGEIAGTLTLASLDQAARALGCRLVYVLVPEKPLTQMLDERADALAEEQLLRLGHSMRLEDQQVTRSSYLSTQKADLKKQLLERPARLWDAG